MTYTAKKNLDILIPLAVACAVGYWFFTKYGAKKWQALIVLMGLTFLATYIATTRATKSILEAAPSSARLPYDLNVEGCKNYDPTADVKAVYDDTQAWFFNSDGPYARLNVLSDCELVKAYNEWNKKYYQTAGSKTLAAAIAGQSSFLDGAFAQTQATLAARFSKMNLA